MSELQANGNSTNPAGAPLASSDAANAANAAVDTAAPPVPTLLLVDDEPGVISSLKRLLRPLKYEVLSANSGAAALTLLESAHVDVIVSDMRMPNMDGAEFLSRSRSLAPDTIRILLTGYSEVDAVVRAVNEGHVYHYLHKPWDDQDLLLTIQRALEQLGLQRKAERLTALLQEQNEKLSCFNQELEREVHARTEEIRQTVMFLEGAQHDLKSNFLTMVKVCANMVEMRCGLPGHSARIGETARQLGAALGLSDYACNELLMAGLLHGIGKLFLPDALLKTPVAKLQPHEAKLYQLHPLHGQMALTPVSQLSAVQTMIRHQYERYDGRGTPDGLVGGLIPLGARVLALARDAEDLRIGVIAPQKMNDAQIISTVRAQTGIRYDPAIAEKYIELLTKHAELTPEGVPDRVDASHLKEGMKLADDLRTSGGTLLMTKGKVLSAEQVTQIRRFEIHEGEPFVILVERAAEARKAEAA
ncbi:HD domain-containing phosphohydrolase [Paraburkholderia rhynchosiae]|uniref:Regulator of RpoS n=1 Tax=Paraburkholderia rhynchosiae TaxID=487049 RepID=A0A2N7WKQ8_9BURK|nr:HD domain-containing phosphohydrolase [Paraburkholderia rhynchosiae]PMS29931.1 two-component system response regulator [Paraburkholderia rhynchosiae]CAB3695884.1 Regulator of RpoS [Paraburkholderia rhynchosiae]